MVSRYVRRGDMAKKVCEKDELYNALGKFIVSFTEIEHWLTCNTPAFLDQWIR
jgi:hypothetical protein